MSREIKFKAVMQRHDGVMYVSESYSIDNNLSYLFDFENDRWGKFLEMITTEERFIALFPDDEHLKGWCHIQNIQYTGLNDKNEKEIYEFMEIDKVWEVQYSNGSYVLINISNDDIIPLYKYMEQKDGQITVTKEYTKV